VCVLPGRPLSVSNARAGAILRLSLIAGDFLIAPMQRPSLWLMIIVLLGGLLFLREPKLEKSELYFLRWLLRYSRYEGPSVPLTVVEIGREAVAPPEASSAASAPASPHAGASAVTPLEMALFLQAAVDYKPAVIAFENVLKWRESDKDQEQVFIDQAMRVPRLLLAAELTNTPDPDAPGPDIAGFTHVTGKSGELPEFSGMGRHPAEELRLISTAGFTNLPDEVTDDLHVPLLFRYRGEVVPSFVLEAILLWLRINPSEVQVALGSAIMLPEGRRIPITSEGTLLVAPNAARRAGRMSLNDLLLAAQERDRGERSGIDLLRDQVVLARTPANPLSPPDIFAAAIATVQSNRYLHRISMVFDCLVLLLAAALCVMLQKFSRVDLMLGAVALTAAYCLIALSVVARWQLWLPGFLPLGTIWLLVIASPFVPHERRARKVTAITVPPPLA
jgi:hypothetical protein